LNVYEQNLTCIRDGSIPVTHYNIYDEWFASIGGVKTHQVNMKGIQRHGAKYRVQKRGQWATKAMALQYFG
jgi:hypothetical protein